MRNVLFHFFVARHENMIDGVSIFIHLYKIHNLSFTNKYDNKYAVYLPLSSFYYCKNAVGCKPTALLLTLSGAGVGNGGGTFRQIQGIALDFKGVGFGRFNTENVVSNGENIFIDGIGHIAGQSQQA